VKTPPPTDTSFTLGYAEKTPGKMPSRISGGLILRSIRWRLVPVVTSQRNEYFPIYQLIEFSRK
jgi:hypothetical protein